MNKTTNKRSILSKGTKASLFFFISSLITSAIAYLMTPVYTRLLSETEYGQVSLYLTFFQTFGIVAMFCLSYGVFNNGMIDYPEKRDEYSFSMLILSNIITLCFTAIFFCLFPIIGSSLKLPWYCFLLMFMMFLVQPAYSFWVARQRYELKYKYVFLWSVVCAILSPLIAVLLILSAKEGERLFPRVFGTEMTLIVIYIGFYVFLGIKNGWKIKTSYWKSALLFNLPLIPHYLSLYLLGSSDKYMISYLIQDNDVSVAYYSVAHTVASAAIIIWSAINATLVPYTYEKCKIRDFESINRVTLPLILIFAIGCVGVIMLAPEVVHFMAPENYMEAIYVIPPIVGGVFFQVQYFVYANIVYYFKKPKYVMMGSVTAVILNIVLNYFCIKQWGYIAAGFTTIFCYFVQAVIDYFAMRKVVGIKVYNMTVISIISFFVVCVSLTSFLFYNLVIVRYTIIVSILIIIIILSVVFRKKIFSLFKMLRGGNEDLHNEKSIDNKQVETN